MNNEPDYNDLAFEPYIGTEKQIKIPYNDYEKLIHNYNILTSIENIIGEHPSREDIIERYYQVKLKLLDVKLLDKGLYE